MDYLQYATYKFASSAGNKNLNRIKKGYSNKKEGVELLGINSYYEKMIESLGDNIKETPLDDLNEDSFTTGELLKVDKSYYILDTGKEYAIFRRQVKESLPLQDEKDFTRLAKKYDDVLSQERKDGDDEYDMLVKMSENGVINRSAYSKEGFARAIVKEVKDNKFLKDIFIEALGVTPTITNIKNFNFNDIKKISDDVLGIGLVQEFYDKAGYKEEFIPKVTGQPSAEQLTLAIQNSDTLKNEEKTELLDLIKKTIDFTEKVSKLPSLEYENISLEDYSNGESLFSLIKKTVAPIENSIENVDLSSFLEENEKYSFFQSKISVNFSCDSDAPDKYTLPTLNKDALKEKAEMFGVKLENKVTIFNFTGSENLLDAIQTIEAQKAIMADLSKEKKAVHGIQKKHDHGAGQQGFAL